MPRLLLLVPTFGLIGLLAAGCAPVLATPPHLVAVWPAASASLPVVPTTFELTFNHTLSAESSWAAVWRDEDGSPLPVEIALEPSNPRRLDVFLKDPAAGEYRLAWHAVSARTAAAVDGEQTFSLQDESARPPRMELSSRLADAGDKVEVAGHGFGKRCTVQLSIGDDEQPLTSIETDARGAFTIETRVPRGVPFGQQPVSAIDTCGASAMTALQVRWGGWPPLVAFDVGQPGPQPGEVTFAVSLRNRSDYVLEHVRVILADPSGAALVSAESDPRRQDQSLVWEIPMMDRGVFGPVRATYRVTGAVTSHASIGFRHRRPRGCSGDDCQIAFVSETTSDSTSVSPPD
ncbi:MAG: copper resistance protein CopC [Chloroflexi bacterium]|nr:copper resistance protein CopC [Chloroflexota bacterium]